MERIECQRRSNLGGTTRGNEKPLEVPEELEKRAVVNEVSVYWGGDIEFVSICKGK